MSTAEARAREIYDSTEVQERLFPEARRMFPRYNVHPEAAVDWMLDKIMDDSVLTHGLEDPELSEVQDQLHEMIWDGLT